MSRDIDVEITTNKMNRMIDFEVATKVMGIKLPCTYDQILFYSTDMNSTIEVVKRMGEMIHETNEIEMRYLSFNGEWQVDTVYDGRNIYAAAPTLPLAICTAALLMNDINYKPKELDAINE